MASKRLLYGQLSKIRSLCRPQHSTAPSSKGPEKGPCSLENHPYELRILATAYALRSTHRIP